MRLFGDGSNLVDFDQPPASVDAERGMIGSMLLDNSCIDDVMLAIEPSDCYRDAHALLCQAIFELRSEGSAVDSITLENRLRQLGELDRAGGLELIFEIRDSVPHSAHARYYAQIVRETSVAREVIAVSSTSIANAKSHNFTAADLVEDVESRTFQISDRRQDYSIATGGEAMAGSLAKIDRLRDQDDSPGLMCGLFDLDVIVGGFHPSQLIVVGARPSIGKTAYALQTAFHVATHHERPVLFVSLEMNAGEIGGRLLSMASGIFGHKIRMPKLLSDSEIEWLGECQYAIARQPQIIINDTPSLTMSQIAASARREVTRRGIGMVVVDYIGLIDTEGSRDNRQEQISKISRRLKTLARELDMPVMALSQLNRLAEGREDRRPRLADLRESGAIEQDADVVILLHRPEFYDEHDSPGQAELIVAKNRNGATGTVKLVFERNLTRFKCFEADTL